MMRQNNLNTFGEKVEGAEYKVREGVYALIGGETDQIALVGRVHSDLHELPGGGLEGEESHEEGLIRELREELGWEIRVGTYLGKGVQYTTLSPRGRYYRLEGHFYTAEKLRDAGGKIEEDHEERWLSFTEALQKVKYDYQKWAIELFKSHQRN